MGDEEASFDITVFVSAEGELVCLAGRSDLGAPAKVLGRVNKNVPFERQRVYRLKGEARGRNLVVRSQELLWDAKSHFLKFDIHRRGGRRRIENVFYAPTATEKIGTAQVAQLAQALDQLLIESGLAPSTVAFTFEIKGGAPTEINYHLLA